MSFNNEQNIWEQNNFEIDQITENIKSIEINSKNNQEISSLFVSSVSSPTNSTTILKHFTPEKYYKNTNEKSSDLSPKTNQFQDFTLNFIDDRMNSLINIDTTSVSLNLVNTNQFDHDDHTNSHNRNINHDQHNSNKNTNNNNTNNNNKSEITQTLEHDNHSITKIHSNFGHLFNYRHF